MIIKRPACFDGSHWWSSVPDFKLINPRPAVLIFKASEAYPGAPFNNTTDPKFVDYFSRSMEIGCIRGAYHFFRKNYDSARQANHFLSVISKVDILPTDILILDVEEGREKASQLWVWLETVKRQYPDNLLMIYSRKNILDAIVMTYAEQEYFKKIPTWPAGYPYFPDLFSSIPNSKLFSYVPDQSKYGPAYFWQYSEVGVVEGINGSVDLNWINPEFYSTLGDNSVAEETIHFTGKCINTDNKVWSSIGGTHIGSVKPLGASVSGDKRATVAGILYLHLTSPIVGWTKKQWFDVVYQTEPPPPPDPEPTPTKTHTIDIFNDGSISVDGQPF